MSGRPCAGRCLREKKRKERSAVVLCLELWRSDCTWSLTMTSGVSLGADSRLRTGGVRPQRSSLLPSPCGAFPSRPSSGSTSGRSICERSRCCTKSFVTPAPQSSHSKLFYLLHPVCRCLTPGRSVAYRLGDAEVYDSVWRTSIDRTLLAFNEGPAPTESTLVMARSPSVNHTLSRRMQVTSYP